MSRTICLGYYDQHNLGDECFKLVLRNLIVRAHHVDEVLFINPCGKLSEQELIATVHDPRTRAVVVGGGDLIRDFWMPKIKFILKDFTRPKLAISVGISYPDCAPYLKYFDRIVVRSSADLEMIKPIRDDAQYVHDVSGVLAKDMPYKIFPTITKTIGICLAQPCFPSNDDSKRAMVDTIIDEILEGLTTFYSKHGSDTCHIYLLPFNTNTLKDAENDLIIQSLFLKQFQQRKQTCPALNVTIQAITDRLDTKQMLCLFLSSLDMVIGMRYHSIMFSLITRTPFIALYSQPKIKNLLQDVGYASSLRDVPIEKCQSLLRDSFSEVLLSPNDPGLPATVNDQYSTALQIVDIPMSKQIIRDENVLFIPSQITLDRILGNVCGGQALSTIIDRLRLDDNLEENVMKFLSSLLNETRKACQAQNGSLNSLNSDDEQRAKQYAFGFMEKIRNKSKGSSFFQPEVDWIVHHFVRNA